MINKSPFVYLTFSLRKTPFLLNPPITYVEWGHGEKMDLPKKSFDGKKYAYSFFGIIDWETVPGMELRSPRYSVYLFEYVADERHLVDGTATLSLSDAIATSKELNTSKDSQQ